MRRARTDSTHAAIRETLRTRGWLVKDVHVVKGWIDMTAYHPATGRVVLIDAKSAQGKLTEAQEALVKAGWPILFLRSVDEASRI